MVHPGPEDELGCELQPGKHVGLRRYEWELNRGHQPVLKRVLEQDENPGRLMVLCVAAIRPPKTSNAGQNLFK